MKPILIVLSPSTSVHEAVCRSMKKAAKDNGSQAQLFHETALLLSGPKSLETLFVLREIALQSRLPFSAFEVESVLTPSAEVEVPKA